MTKTRNEISSIRHLGVFAAREGSDSELEVSVLFGATCRHTSAGKVRRLHGAFTLVELMIVIVIVAMIAAILLPSLSAAKKRALRSSMIGNGSVSEAAARLEAVKPGQMPVPQRPLGRARQYPLAGARRAGP